MDTTRKEARDDGGMAKPLSIAKKASHRAWATTVSTRELKHASGPSNSFSSTRQGRGKPESSHCFFGSLIRDGLNSLKCPPIYGQDAGSPFTQRDTTSSKRLSDNSSDHRSDATQGARISLGEATGHGKDTKSLPGSGKGANLENDKNGAARGRV
ncbi:hypothetical protein Nepgr_003663 [Nepenthes gracilis]|uniref:Uncharacterized protein n=1 Tax=Nepenthes gracilis TaxID=150966 RepID=A0AAD3RZX2_NEPGR|nr:hypothetical protein Nepgr_003663 [Nepenthes gracilis]